MEEREEIGLSSPNTIVEVIGDQKLVEEAVEYVRSRGIGGWDLETGGLNPFRHDIILCQLGDADKQYIIWWQTIDPQPILDLIGDPDVYLVGVNLKFDLRFILANYGVYTPAHSLIDTMLNEQVMHCGLTGPVFNTMHETGMGQTAYRWFGWIMPKDDELRTGWERMEPGNWETYKDGEPIPRGAMKRFYAADDVIVPMYFKEIQRLWIKKLDLVNTVKQEQSFLPVLAAIETYGMKLDWAQWEQLAQEAEEQKAKAEDALDRLFEVRTTIYIDQDGNEQHSRNKNYGSPHELRDLIREWMMEHYGVEVIAKNDHLYQALKAAGVNPRRLDTLFESKLVPDPDNPEKRKQVGYPNNFDLVEQLWEDYKTYLPEGAFVLEDTESKTLTLMRILHETPDEEIDDHFPTKLGLPPELVDPILEYRDGKTKLERYAWNWADLIEPKTGRVHSDFTQAATDTGRASSSPNFQNIPSDQRYRDCFITEKGYLMVGADWSQIEPRIIAELSFDPVYMRTFWSGYPGTEGFNFWCDEDVVEKLDIYVEVGKQIGLIPKHYTVVDCKGDDKAGIDPKPDGKKGRKQSKIAVLGLGYGQGTDKFQLMVIRDTGEYHPKAATDKLYHGFFSAVQGVKAKLDELSDLADIRKTDRIIWHPYIESKVAYSESLGGRKRFFEPTNPLFWTMGRNHPIQSTGGDILKDSVMELFYWMRDNNIDGCIVNQIHDEIMAEVREDQAEIVRDKMVEIMSAVGERYCPHVPIAADAYISDHWVKD